MREILKCKGVIGLALVILVAGCNSTSTTTEGPTTPGETVRTEVGKTYLDGKVELLRVDGPDPATGRISFVVLNRSADDLLDVPFVVHFYYIEKDPETGIETRRPVYKDVTVSLYRGQATPVTAVAEKPLELRGYELLLQEVASVGQEYIGGKLRLVELHQRLSSTPPELSFVLQNVSSSPVEAPDYLIIFRTRTREVLRTEYRQVQMQAIPPGGRVSVQPDLRGISQDLTGLQVVIQLREFIL